MLTLDKAERDALVQLALGRIFRLMSRPAQPGDIEEFERCRAIILTVLDPACTPVEPVHCWARDRKGDVLRGGS